MNDLKDGKRQYVSIALDSQFYIPVEVVDQGAISYGAYQVWQPSTGGLFEKSTPWKFFETLEECIEDCRNKLMEDFEKELRYHSIKK